MTPDVLLCDADGNLFASEEPAFEASAGITNSLLESLGIDRRFTPAELMRETTGKTFRTTANEIAARHGVQIDKEELERWVAQERRTVTARLGQALRPDLAVLEPLKDLAARYRLAVVSSSASVRLDACFAATGLDALFPPETRFSAEDSLPVPTSKPDPAIYVHACERLSVEPSRALAIEDALPGVQSAVAAGVPVVGNLVFVPEPEREERRRELADAGARSVVADWRELARTLLRGQTP